MTALHLQNISQPKKTVNLSNNCAKARAVFCNYKAEESVAVGSSIFLFNHQDLRHQISDGGSSVQLRVEKLSSTRVGADTDSQRRLSR